MQVRCGSAGRVFQENVVERTFSYQSQNFSGDNLVGFVIREDTQRTPFAMFVLYSQCCR
jgi:hypothetical protein